MARPSKSEITDIDQIAAKFAQIMGAPKKTLRPPNSVTVAEYAKFAQITDKTAGAWLRKLFNEGKCSRIRCGNAFYYNLNE
jgi:hypothetical protein